MVLYSKVVVLPFYKKGINDKDKKKPRITYWRYGVFVVFF